jgi:hypothetical protein
LFDININTEQFWVPLLFINAGFGIFHAFGRFYIPMRRTDEHLESAAQRIAGFGVYNFIVHLFVGDR